MGLVEFKEDCLVELNAGSLPNHRTELGKAGRRHEFSYPAKGETMLVESLRTFEIQREMEEPGRVGAI
jgi:hypothetical protein